MRSTLVIILSCIGLLSGCSALSDDCYEQECWTMTAVKSACGIKIIDHCQATCDACTYDEPSCKICMQCVTSENGWHPACPVTRSNIR